MKRIGQKSELPVYFFVFGLFLILISPNFLSEGMFMDGLIYSVVSKNLASGIGSFWDLKFSETIFSEFHEHPPLAMGIQSVFYTLFGEGRFVEKFYSVLTILISAFGIVKIWKHFKLEFSWFPLFLFISNTLVIWVATNNLLENTMTIFIVFSVYFYLKSTEKRRILYVALSGFMLCLGFLSKGFVAFFPWILPFLWWLIVKREHFLRMLSDTFIMIGTAILPIILLMFISLSAKESIMTYLEIQVLNSLKHVVTVNSRFYIVSRVFMDLLPALMICLLILFWAWRKKIPFQEMKTYGKFALVFVLLGVSGVLPIMVSLKQRSFYALPAFPFLVIGIGLLIYPMFQPLWKNVMSSAKRKMICAGVGYGTFIVGILFSVYFIDKYGREEAKIRDARMIIEVIPSGTIINIPESLQYDFGVLGYYQRFKGISLDCQSEHKRDFFLIKNEGDYNASRLEEYTLIELPTLEYSIYKKKGN